MHRLRDKWGAVARSLRSCRPFSEAVMGVKTANIAALFQMLRSCRPFSEAVILNNDSIRCGFQGSFEFS